MPSVSFLFSKTALLIFNASSYFPWRTGDADLRLYAYKQFKYPVPNVLKYLNDLTLLFRFVSVTLPDKY
jgi:hypothetical protein